MIDQLFQYRENPVRVVGSTDEPLFIAKDVCAILELSDVSKATKGLDSDELIRPLVVSGGQRRQMNAVTESGLYALIFKSRKAEAKLFRKWVTSEVLPALRKEGRYDTAEAAQAYDPEAVLNNPDLIIRLATEVKDLRREAELNAKKVEVMAPVAKFGQELLDADGLFTFTQVAKPLGTGAIKLNRFLCEQGVIRKHRDEWWPMHRYQDSGHFRIVAHHRTVHDSVTGEEQQRTFHQLKVTPKGRELIHRKWREAGHGTPAPQVSTKVQLGALNFN